MDIKTLVIGYVPLVDTTGRKAREIKEDAYMRELFAGYDLGELHYAHQGDWKEKADQIDPLFIILLGNDYYAKEVHAYKINALLHTTYNAGQIFRRKAEMEERMEKHRSVLRSIEALVLKARDKGEEEVETIRSYAAMSYDDLYSMIKKAIAGKDDKLRHEAWDLLFGENVRGDFLWMRVNFLADVWDGADGKGREELMCIAMDQFIAEGTARKLDVFTDEDGQQYHQYMFCDFHGEDLKYIRRIPFGEKGQDKYTYEALLRKNEVPLNFVRVMLEAGQMRDVKADYFKKESEKVAKVLAAWKENPTLSRKELGVGPCCKEHGEETPLTDVNIEHLKEFLNEHDPVAFAALF